MSVGANAVAVTQATWQAEVVASPVPVLVDFWAEWCGPCRAIGPTLEEIAGEQKGKLKVCKVNVDTDPQLAAKFGVRSIPTMVLMKGGAVQTQIVGAMGKSALLAKLGPFL